MDVRDVERTWQVWAVLDKDESFHSGYMDKAQAEHALADVNKRAGEMGIKTRYVLKEFAAVKPAEQAPTVSPTVVPDVTPTA